MNKILIIKHGSLGDLVFALPAIEAIYNKFSKSSIHFLTERKYNTFISRLKIFEKIIEDDRKNSILNSIFLLFKLSRNKYDLVIDLQNSQRTSIYNLYFRLFTKSIICSSRSFAHLRYIIPKQGKENVTTGLLNQLRLLQINYKHNINFNWLRTELNRKIKNPFVLLIPGISNKNLYKQWEPYKFAEIANYFEKKDLQVCVVGTKDDFISIQPIILRCKKIINMIEKSPPEVIYSLALESKLIISNDTGPGHIASLSDNNIIWIVNDNKITQANIKNNSLNHRIASVSVKDITTKEVIHYIENNNLL